MGGVGVGPEVAAAAGERWRVRRRLDFGFFKKREKESCYSHCLLKTKGLAFVCWVEVFLTIKEASQFRFTFIIQRLLKKASYFNLYLLF